MSTPHETAIVTTTRVCCDGASGIPGGAALGHPRVWLTIPHEAGFIDCPYCDARYTLAAGASDAH